MTPAKIAASKRNGLLGGRPRKPTIECSCGRTDGSHAWKCRITETLRKRAQRQAKRDNVADATLALAQPAKAGEEGER